MQTCQWQSQPDTHSKFHTNWATSQESWKKIVIERGIIHFSLTAYNELLSVVLSYPVQKAKRWTIKKNKTNKTKSLRAANKTQKEEKHQKVQNPDTLHAATRACSLPLLFLKKQSKDSTSLLCYSKSLTESPKIFLNVPQQITKIAPAFQLSAVSQEDCCCRADQLSDHRHTHAHHLLKPALWSEKGDKSQIIITQWSLALIIFLYIKSSPSVYISAPFHWRFTCKKVHLRSNGTNAHPPIYF